MIGARMRLAPVLAALAMSILTGCPQDEKPVEILLVNAFEEMEVRSLRLYDADVPVSDNLLQSAVESKHSRRIFIPLQNILAADAIGVSFGAPGEGLTIRYLPDDVDGGFQAGKVIPFIVHDGSAFDAPLDNTKSLFETEESHLSLMPFLSFSGCERN